LRGRWSGGTSIEPVSPELRERAVRMVAEVRADYSSDWPAICAVAQKLGIGTAETLRKWVRHAEVVGGQRPGGHHGGSGRDPAAEAGERRVAPRQRDSQGGVLRFRGSTQHCWWLGGLWRAWDVRGCRRR